MENIIIACCIVVILIMIIVSFVMIDKGREDANNKCAEQYGIRFHSSTWNLETCEKYPDNIYPLRFQK